MPKPLQRKKYPAQAQKLSKFGFFPYSLFPIPYSLFPFLEYCFSILSTAAIAVILIVIKSIEN